MPETNIIKWDEVGARIYETGVKKGVLYPQVSGVYPQGVAWNGLTAVNESPSGAEATSLYADDIEYAILRGAEKFAATIEAYTYPDEFAECDGSKELVPGVKIGQQKRKAFGFSYVTTVGNDVDGEEYGYKIHLVYGATAAPSEKAHSTINDSPEAMTMSWELSTTPVAVTGGKPTATVELDSTKLKPEQLKAIEDALYGTTEKAAYLPLPDEVKTIIESAVAG